MVTFGVLQLRRFQNNSEGSDLNLIHFSFLNTFGRKEKAQYTYKTREKSNVGNKSYGASKFSKMGHQYTDVVDVDSAIGGCV